MSPFQPLSLRGLRALGLACVFAALPFVAACDFTDDDDDGGSFSDSDVVYVDFSFDGDDYGLSENGDIASFESSNLDDADDREAIEAALDGADEGALVLLYADGSLIFNGGGGTWTALPVTVGYEATGSDDVPYVDYTVTYSYSYDDQDLYFDAFSSALLGVELFDDILPSRIDLRLVTAPASELFRLDVRNYEAVRQALSLPE